MSRTDKARAQLEAVLGRGETMQACESALLKGGAGKRMAKDVAISAAASIALAAISGGSATSASAPPQVWIVVTDRRILLFQDTRERRRPVGDMMMDAPREDLFLTSKSGVWTEVALVDAESGDPVARLNFGVRKKDAAAVLAA